MAGPVAFSVIPIIRRTRELLLPGYGRAGETARKAEDAHSVVTALDHAVEEVLAAELRRLDPSIEFVGEERGGNSGAERFWLCDPIDGTVHYLRGIPHCTVMLALIERHQVQFGAIYDFVNDVLFHAERGGGAFANGEPIHVSHRPARDAFISCESDRRKPRNQAVYQRLYERFSIMTTLSSGHEFALVASGKLEARVSCDPFGKAWDYAPGALLVSEAGGIVANIGKRDYDYRDCNFIAASPNVYRILTEGPDAVFAID
jgi:myo-inositol-1(or 4)-monophosphatase